jgi:hypothetical protein
MRPGRNKHISQSASSYLDNRVVQSSILLFGLLKSARVRAQVLEECLQVLDLQAEDTRQDQTRDAALDLVEVLAQAVEWGVRRQLRGNPGRFWL